MTGGARAGTEGATALEEAQERSGARAAASAGRGKRWQRACDEGARVRSSPLSAAAATLDMQKRTAARGC